MPETSLELLALAVDAIGPIEVGPGCTRRDLPSRDGVRVWVVDMAPGSQWPRIDEHDEYGEDILVVSGDLIEGEEVFGPGDFLHYGPGSRHRPRTLNGVRLFGFNLRDRPPAPGCAS